MNIKDNDNYKIQQSFFDGTEQSHVAQAIKLIQTFEASAIRRNPVGYVVGYSGGKDSEVLVDLFRKAKVRFMIINNHTTIDAPETVYFIRRQFAKWEAEGIPCKIYYPQINFWSLCLKFGFFPLRRNRFCCAELKERDVPELRFATYSFGVRKAESVKRAAHRDSIEMRDKKDYSDIQLFHFDNSEEVKQTDACYTKNYFIVNPIAYWSEAQVWDYIHENHLDYNPLYDCGMKRVGCIACPMNRHAKEELAHYPKYEARFRKLADDIIAKRTAEGKPLRNFKTGQEYFEWWIGGGAIPNSTESTLSDWDNKNLTNKGDEQ